MIKKLFLILASIAVLIVVVSQAPSSFPTERFDIPVESGDSISSVANELSERGVIRSKILFKASAVILSINKGILAGDYRFNYPQNAISIAYRMVHGHQGQSRIRITIPEGTNVFDMAYIYQKSLPNFSAPRFVSLAKKYEGYLYPDTYYFFENAKAEDIITTMKDNFDKKIATIQSDIDESGKTLEEILIMSSLVEKEAYADESRKIIAGILWKRIDEGMPLQVDAPFYYITGKAGGYTLDDLKIDSPYNTYIHKGLPVAPISNPSLDTIIDTLEPMNTKYYYYLTGNDGVMRYAETFAGHIENKNLYLR